MTTIERLIQEARYIEAIGSLDRIIAVEDRLPRGQRSLVLEARTLLGEGRATEAIEKIRRIAYLRKANAARRARHEAMTDLGLVRVRGALGGIYYE